VFFNYIHCSSIKCHVRRVNFFLKTYKKEKGRRVNSISMFEINLLLTKILQEVGIQKKKKKKKKGKFPIKNF